MRGEFDRPVKEKRSQLEEVKGERVRGGNEEKGKEVKKKKGRQSNNHLDLFSLRIAFPSLSPIVG